MPPFFNRERDLRSLREVLTTRLPSLVFVYGRRRVGKSALLREVIRNLPAVYYQATRVSDTDGQALFRAELERVLGADPVLSGLRGWEAIFTYLQKLADSTRPGLVVVIDEFPYLCEANKALPSIVQKVWDNVRATGSRLALVLCGSQIAFMESLVLSERNPLYGRHSASFNIQPLSCRDVIPFIPEWSDEDVLRAYGVFGGLPFYWSLIDPSVSLARNIEHIVLSNGAPLRDEATYILQAEFTNVSRYASVLHAVADGCTKRDQIGNRVLGEDEDRSVLSPYFDRLESLRLLERVHSLDTRGSRTRDIRFYLCDPFLSFYYRFVLPNISALQAGHASTVYREQIQLHLDEYMGNQFEIICRQYVRLYAGELLGSECSEVGKIWTKSYDIDVAGTLLDKTRFVGECKWSKQKLHAGTFASSLLARAEANTYYQRRTPRWVLLFSRAGFARQVGEEHLAYVRRITPAELTGSRNSSITHP